MAGDAVHDNNYRPCAALPKPLGEVEKPGPQNKAARLKTLQTYKTSPAEIFWAGPLDSAETRRYRGGIGRSRDLTVILA
jgi:hypothetical protein